ncbi:translation factor GUF1 (macronuclear) [Tetrahymena thermophila SB210]|uniref:Translation factor GUF1 homolog, mitochondrial n=1 Tax=Tetrahymena thermophila (strain SB210) TaxID=312017 RepID=I7MLS1_TETTS|nr:translation factor GUF1 [Tetrahymena thermophila SB210]EAS02961.2 translation factor GUF1 [Tetrahymena thermophila SB210]|eukprot:XP_001023206.2 translation factor GUF1 [Tetrahymena thermophila SB210]
MLKKIFKQTIQINQIPKYFLASPKPNFPIDKIRNFNIIAHIDHGKSTLADRILEMTGTIVKGEQYLDKLQVEKERGITVKAQTAAMTYEYKGEKYLLNLIDTPGHVDFHYEVSRSMRSCSGSLLLVDACQGIQAQTLSNYEKAKDNGLKIIPVINKIDMPAAHPEEVAENMQLQFDVEKEDIHFISAKTGVGVDGVLRAVVEKLDPPKADINKPFKGFLIDSWFIKDQGVVMLVQVKDGCIAKGEQIMSCAFKKRYDIFEVGILNPEMTPQNSLTAGQVGYIFTNMKAVSDARVGDTFHKPDEEVEPEQGFQEARPMVFAGLYPDDPEDYMQLEKSIYKLALTDPAVHIYKESSAALGNGFRCGFLGLLHMDVFKQRLDDEYNLDCFLTTPSVPYRAKLRNSQKILEVENALMAPDDGLVEHYEEPLAEATILCPKEYVSAVMNLADERRGEQKEINIVDEKRFKLKYTFPLSEIITDFFDKLKSATQGYASLDYYHSGFREAKIKKLVILLMGEPVDSLSFMVHERRAHDFGKNICKKLKEKLPGQQFTVAIQAKLGSKIIAREEIPALRKNVTAKCYGGDYSRKKKLLERQKEGKKNMRSIGRVQIGKDTFVDILKN